MQTTTPPASTDSATVHLNAGGVTTQQSLETGSTSITATQLEPQVTTVVQEIDAAGPVVVERISTQFADLACTPENARMLVEGIHGGTEIRLNADGKTATIRPTGALGYGETYLALSLAAEALRQAGVTGCATPDQWQAVLLGGPLSAAGTTVTTTSRRASASSSSNFPGILTLHSQGQGWGQVAQQTNVQLGQVVSNAHSSLNLSANTTASSSTNKDSALTPTGKSSAEMNQSSAIQGKNDKDTLNKRSSLDHRDNDRDNDHDNDKGKPGKDDNGNDNTPVKPPVDK